MSWRFFFKNTSTTQIYTLSLHDALPIFCGVWQSSTHHYQIQCQQKANERQNRGRSEEHTSELQSRRDLVCRLLLEKKTGTSPFSGFPLISRCGSISYSWRQLNQRARLDQ